MRINIQNVEELIFQNKEIWQKMPDLMYLRDQWRMSNMTPMLRAMGKKSLLEFLRVAKESHEDIISEHFQTMVTIDKIERHIVKNVEFSVDDEDLNFDSHEIYTAFSTYRKGDKIYMTFWR
jgi:hypothetical protein